jgi:hypothetical protein
MFVTRLKCSVYTKFKDRIKNKRNYSGKWLVEEDSVWTSNIPDHAFHDQHTAALSSSESEELDANQDDLLEDCDDLIMIQLNLTNIYVFTQFI